MTGRLVVHVQRWAFCLALCCGFDASAADAPPIDRHAEELKRCFALQRSEPAQAIALADAILAARPLPVETEIKALSCLGMATALSGDSARAVDAAGRMEQLFDANTLPSDIALRTLSNAGAILHTAGQTHRALVLYDRAERAAAADDAIVVQVKNLINIALIHAEDLDDAAGAELLFERAQTLSATLGEPDLLLEYNHARNLVRLDRRVDAMAALERAEVEAKRLDNRLIGARIQTDRSALLYAQERSAEARAVLDAAIAMQKALPDPGGESASLTLRARMQRDGNDAAGALRSAQDAETLAVGDAFLRKRIDAIHAQAEALQALGRTEDALLQVQRAAALELGALKQQNLDGLAALQARLQDADSVRELERLRYDNQLQLLRADQAETSRNILLTCLFVFLLAVVAFMLFQRRVNRRLRKLSTVDALTGLVNRRAATHQIDTGVPDNGAPDAARALILLIDIDHFKQVNDRHGHAVGDLVLTELAARLKMACRPDDIVSRWGGEEFLVACGRFTLEQARGVADRLRAAVGDVPFPLPDGQTVTATISVGFAPYPFFPGDEDHSEKPWQDALRLADRALYAAKHAGRDAWVGLWGVQEHGDIAAVLRDPALAEYDRVISIVANRAVNWAPPAG